MIDRENILFNKRLYYTPSWTGVTKVSILMAYNNGKLLVQANDKPFIRTDRYVFKETEEARKSIKKWQHYDRKRRRIKKEKRRAKEKEK